MNEVKKTNVTLNKNGNGFFSYKLNLPKRWLTEIGVTEDEKEIILEYDEIKKQIIIKKS